MHRFMAWVRMFCLMWLGVITLIWIASYLLVHVDLVLDRLTHTASAANHTHTLADDLVVFDALVGDSYEIFITDQRCGATRQLTNHFGNDRFPALSPDGTQVAFVSWRDGNSEIYIMDLAREMTFNLSHCPGQDVLPVWSPDGTLLAYTSRSVGNSDVFIADVSRRLTQNLTRNPAYDGLPQWSADGQWLVFTSNREGRHAQYGVDLAGHTLVRHGPQDILLDTQNASNMSNIEELMPG
jgi:Tol biopolymer transport system component